MKQVKRAIAIDFDGTLFTECWPEIGEPIWPVIQAAKQEHRNGAELILWTTRSGKELEAAIDACEKVGLRFEAVNTSAPDWIEAWGNDPRKIGATEYWDDRAVSAGMFVERAVDPATGLPCRIGDMVWCLRKLQGRLVPRAAVVTGMQFTSDMRLAILCRYAGGGFWGERIFPTKKAAEAKISQIARHMK